MEQFYDKVSASAAYIPRHPPWASFWAAGWAVWWTP